MPQDDIQDKPRSADARIAKGKKRWREIADAQADIRTKALDDLKFSVGDDQWPKEIADRRVEEGKPVITVNRFDQHLKLVGNEQRQQRPALKINPVGDGSDKDTAEIIQGVCRHIEVGSDAEVVYDESFDGMLRGGFHYFRVLPEYVDEQSPDNFDQELRIRLIKNAFTVYFDNECLQPDYSDAYDCFVVEEMSPASYRNKYKGSELAGLDDFTSVGDTDGDWANENTVRVAEWFHVDVTYKTVKSGEGSKAREKKVADRKVTWCKFNAIEILEERDWPGRWIPIVPVLGTDKIIDGKRYLAGLVRNAKGAQRSYNFGISSAWEVAGLAPKAPFICDYRTIAQWEDMWEQSNRRNLAALYYDSQPEGVQTPLPPPQRNAVEPPLQAFVELIRQADLDFKACVGMYDPSVGQNKSDQSGKAIQSLQKQGDLATLNYSDNLARSIRHLGRILVDLIPKIYDAPRVQRIINPDSSVDHVGVFNSKTSGMNAEQVKALQGFEKIKKIYDIGVGTYDVTVDVGPSYQTKRQEASATQIELTKNVPVVQAIAADLVIRNMDIPGADEIADRVNKMIMAQNPFLQEDPADDPKKQLAQAQAQLTQLSQQMQQLQQVATEQKQIIDSKQVENQAKVTIAQLQETSKQEVVKLQEATKIAVAQINASKDMQQTYADQELKQYELLHMSSHDAASAAQQRGHEQQLAQQGATQEQGMESAKQGHELHLADKSQSHEKQMTAANQSHEAQMAERGHSQALEQQEQAAKLAPKPKPEAK